jgi:hypothetical protein
MKQVIRRNQKNIALSLALALIAIAFYIFLKAKGIITLNCPAHYLNPWQYFFQCSMFNLLIYLAVGIPVFLVAFFITKKKV